MVQSGKRSLGVEQTRSCKTTVRFGERSSRQIHCNGAIEHNSKRSTCMLIERIILKLVRLHQFIVIDSVLVLSGSMVEER